MHIRRDDECYYVGSGPASEMVQPAKPGPDWATLGPELLEVLEFALRDMEAVREQYARHAPNVGVLAVSIGMADALIAKAKESGA
jgi:hypothetical protein